MKFDGLTSKHKREKVFIMFHSHKVICKTHNSYDVRFETSDIESITVLSTNVKLYSNEFLLQYYQSKNCLK